MVRDIHGRSKDDGAADPDPNVWKLGKDQEADNGREGEADKVKGQDGSYVGGREGTRQEPLVQCCKDADSKQKQKLPDGGPGPNEQSRHDCHRRDVDHKIKDDRIRVVGAGGELYNRVAGSVGQRGRQHEKGAETYLCDARAQDDQGAGETHDQGQNPWRSDRFAEKKNCQQSSPERRGEDQRLRLGDRDKRRAREIGHQEGEPAQASEREYLVVLRLQPNASGADDIWYHQKKIRERAEEGDLKRVDIRGYLTDERGHDREGPCGGGHPQTAPDSCRQVVPLNTGRHVTVSLWHSASCFFSGAVRELSSQTEMVFAL